MENPRFSITKFKRNEMESKNILVSFLAIASLLLLAQTVHATEITEAYDVTVEDVYAYYNSVSVDAGEMITVKVFFTALNSDTDVTIKADIEGDKTDTTAITQSFDVEAGKSYRKSLSIKVPYDLKDQLSDDATLTIKIDGRDYKTELCDITLRIQRPSYNADIKSVTVNSRTSAGDTIPVDIVLKNTGYNNLDDVYVTAKIAELGVEKTSYFGDLVALESDNDDEDKDTVSGRLNLDIPYEAKTGVYTLVVTVTNDDTTSSVTKQLSVENEVTKTVIASNTQRTVSVGKDAVYNILLVNPTDKLKVYRVVTESSGDLSSSTDEAVVAVPAGSSKTVTISARAETEGQYDFDVSVFSGENLIDTVKLTANVEASKEPGRTSFAKNPVVVLTVILAIIFLVLLVVLVVLLGKKPEKSEEFGESYY